MLNINNCQMGHGSEAIQHIAEYFVVALFEDRAYARVHKCSAPKHRPRSPKSLDVKNVGQLPNIIYILQDLLQRIDGTVSGKRRVQSLDCAVEFVSQVVPG